MQTLTTCMQCQTETGIPNFSSLGLADMPESGIIEVTCNRGHRTAIIVQESKFEILAAMGFKAIVAGSYRDGVSSLASSLERLYEFFIEATCRKRGILPDAYAETWKAMASQSERQLGAFLSAYLLETGEAAKLLPQKQLQFRNGVVHKGTLPSREEASRFGKALFECAVTVLTVLRSPAYRGVVEAMNVERVRARSKQAREAGMIPSTMSMMTPLSLNIEGQTEDFDAILASYAQWPDLKRVIEESRELCEMIDLLVDSTKR